MSYVQLPFLAAPGNERPDYTIFTGPAATIVDTASEEIELDQALSLAGRFGRDYLGMQIFGAMGEVAAEHQTITAADHFMGLVINLQSRTGAFGAADPEVLDEWTVSQATSFITGTATDAFLFVWNPIVEQMAYGEPELYVAPRLFFDFENNLDASITADVMAVRIASVSRKLTFELFVELLERFADVTLL